MPLMKIVFVCGVMFYQLLAELLLITWGPPNDLKVARVKSEFRWGGRTVCSGGSSWLHLLLRDILPSGIFFLPHASRHRTVILSRSWPVARWPGN